MKTLKDIEDFNGLNPTFISREKLKQEAIKWMKFRGRGEISQWIEYFFNITKEDLENYKKVQEANKCKICEGQSKKYICKSCEDKLKRKGVA